MPQAVLLSTVQVHLGMRDKWRMDLFLWPLLPALPPPSSTPQSTRFPMSHNPLLYNDFHWLPTYLGYSPNYFAWVSSSFWSCWPLRVWFLLWSLLPKCGLRFLTPHLCPRCDGDNREILGWVDGTHRCFRELASQSPWGLCKGIRGC